MTLAEALIEPKFTDADAAKLGLIREPIELGATVGLMPSYA